MLNSVTLPWALLPSGSALRRTCQRRGLWCFVRSSSGNSGRAIGITQKSAWFLDHRIRFALGLGSTNKFSGQIEADETFIGGKARNMHKTKRESVITGTGQQRNG